MLKWRKKVRMKIWNASFEIMLDMISKRKLKPPFSSIASLWHRHIKWLSIIVSFLNSHQALKAKKLLSFIVNTFDNLFASLFKKTLFSSLFELWFLRKEVYAEGKTSSRRKEKWRRDWGRRNKLNAWTERLFKDQFSKTHFCLNFTLQFFKNSEIFRNLKL